jgi:hypothetical protein
MENDGSATNGLTGYPVSVKQSEDIDNRFMYHSPFGDQPERYSVIREAGRVLANTLTYLCPPSRELSLALTKLEEAIMWANAAIARNEKQETGEK